ncbi:hypothetical protein [Sansalvadorimonas verongulae]|uniref:hypothetical protein n=1 Tax=Sansalvadorimonas verongulae TaxID=2172824 RepID=UPI0012BD1682|nr:hypothetical protein [Sansalvadorimonas verongulae]MTI13377.1 hypothetical protein [Sansalvadorimonas verongulae]
MDWKDVKDLIGNAAPVVGAALGGPAGATVGGMIANMFGTDATPSAVAQAITADKTALVDIRKMEFEHKEQLEKLAFQTLEIELNDKANARASHKDSRMPAVIVWLMSLLVGGLTYALFHIEIPDANKDVAFMLFGQVVTLWGASITYWVGTTRGSADKNRLIASGGGKG